MALVLKSNPARRWLTVGNNQDGKVNIEVCDSVLHELCDYKITKEEAIQIIEKLKSEFDL